MNVLLIDVYGCYLDLALRAMAAGHSVRWFQGKWRDGEKSEIGRGLVTKIPAWEPSMNWADLILCSDNVKYIHGLERYRKQGFPIFGPGVEGTSWELDRAKGQRILKDAGCKLMDSIEFSSLSQAKDFLMRNPGRYVSKPNADDNKAMSYVAKSARDLMFMIERWQKGGNVKGDFIFQKFVPGIEVAVGGWVGRDGFLSGFLENFEHKKLMNGEVGVNTGEMGTVMKYVTKSNLADCLLRPLEPELIRQGYTGYIDVSVIVSEQGHPLPLEFTCRPGWPLFQIQQSLHKGDPVQWMADSLEGNDTFKFSDEIAAGVVMTIPDFPYGNRTRQEVCGYPLYGWEKIGRRYFHPAELQAGEVWQVRDGNFVKEPGLVTAGDYVCVVSGCGEKVREAKEEAYSNLKKLEIPNSPMYRTDIGDRLKEQLPILQEHGFCESWRF